MSLILSRARLLADGSLEDATFITQIAGSLFKWVAASCLSINAAAIVACLTMTAVDPASRFWAGLWFLSGMIVSLLLGITLAISLLRLGFGWSEVSRGLRRFATTKENAALDGLDSNPLIALGRLADRATYLQLLPIVSFIVGIVILLEGLA